MRRREHKHKHSSSHHRHWYLYIHHLPNKMSNNGINHPAEGEVCSSANLDFDFSLCFERKEAKLSFWYWLRIDFMLFVFSIFSFVEVDNIFFISEIFSFEEWRCRSAFKWFGYTIIFFQSSLLILVGLEGLSIFFLSLWEYFWPFLSGEELKFIF